MPITGPSSYVPTTAEFVAHWTDANAELPALQPLLLSDGTDLASFSTARTVLLSMRDELEAADLDVQLARGAMNLAKGPLLAKLNLFNTLVRGAMGTSVYARALPLVPGIGDGQQGFSQPMVQAMKLWAKINAAPPAGVTAPVVLVDGTTQAVFAAAVEALAELYGDVVGAEQEFALALARRNDVQDEIYRSMKLYRETVPTRFMPDSPLLASLPALSPDSGRTPDPVELSGAWDAGLAAARLTATVSNDPDLKEYELRWCPGAVFSTDTDHVVGSVPAGEPPVFVTTKGLGTSGAVASFRVYVRLTSGGEAGSETVVVERP
jgi:hypothetical protein